MDRENTQRRNILIGVTVIAVLVILVIGYGVLDSLYLQQIRPVAKVDGQSITVRDFKNMVRYQRYNLVNQIVQFQQYGDYFKSYVESYQSYLDNTETLGQDVLDRMVDNLVVAQEAKAENITVSNAEVDAALQAAFDFYANGTPTPTLTITPFATGTP
ncbi:SurA N-terminal domain-containing protein, partial [Longilinea arvoryzae]|uniref:SurA N-terminal domain-containing protein n=1 Tax=Longilinea arvoryzae TaxID=360412 RepID=UPI001560293B